MSAGWRELWDFDDLDLSETRFRAALERASADTDRAGLLTQLARVEGLRGRFDEGNVVLDEAEALCGEQAWVLIERGRLLRSKDDAVAALPLFEQAFELAVSSGDSFLAGDAAHMAALAGDGEAWTARGIELASSADHPGAAYWLGPLLNNIGWSRYEAGRLEGALDAFEQALAARAADPAKPYEREIGRYAVGMALRALGRPDEAVAQLEQAVAWAQEAGVEDAYFHEELAEDYAAAGRPADAAAQATRALELVAEGDESRTGRLRALASLVPDSL